jgi:hypothetical protein
MMSTLTRSLVLACAASLLSLTAAAQETTTKFRVAPDPGNIQSCTAVNFGMTGVHTITVKGADVTLSTAGGLISKMTMVKPNIYESNFELAGTRLDSAVDLGAKTFTLSEKARGCKWVGVPM